MTEQSTKILALDDDKQILALVRRCLERAGFSVLTASTVKQAIEIVASDSISLAIVDLILADGHGLDVTRTLWNDYDIPVIILSGLDEPTEKIVGLQTGADDYMTKPFDPGELTARVRTVLRRVSKKPKSSNQSNRIYCFEGWRVDADARALSDPDGRAVETTSGEFDLLLTLITQAGRVLTRNQIMDDIYGKDAPAFDRSVDVKIGRLRKKIEINANKPSMIKTVRNFGYVFSATVERQDS
jgi:DNA-binding response OmpR family regulator